MEELASRELQSFLKAATGAEFPIGSGEKALILKRDSGLAAQEASVDIVGDDIVLAGGDQWGILYAVYSFLENQLGIRWFTPYANGTKIPRYDNLAVSFEAYTQKPLYTERSVIGLVDYNRYPGGTMFFLRNRINISNRLKNPDFPGSDTLYTFKGHNCHTLFMFIPPKKGYYPQLLKFKSEKYYFADHPEYFGMNAQGKRVMNLQLCFSNPGLRQELTRRVFEYAEIIGGSGVIGVSQMDYPGAFCYCSGCKALVNRYQTPAGPMMDYLIELGKASQKRFPELKIMTLAYRKDQSERPPVLKGEKLPENLVIAFAPIDNDFSKNMSHPNNARTLKNLAGWCKISDHVWTWYYAYTWGGDLPYGMLERDAQDVKIMADAGLRGTFYEFPGGVRNGLTSGDLLVWMLLKLYQDPALDYKALMKEFCEFYYGAAAGDMLGYFHELDKHTKENKSFHIWNGGAIKTCLSVENIARWSKLFDAMEGKVQAEPVALSRVRDARIALDLAALNNYYKIAKKFPGVLPSAAELKQRIVASIDDALLRRFPAENFRKVQRQGLLKAVELAEAYGVSEPAPLPHQFSKIPAEKIRQAFPQKGANKLSVLEDPSAGFGYAVYIPDKVEVPFTCGVYDAVNRKFLLSRRIAQEDIVPDCYHFYKVGMAPIPSNNTLVWATSSWRYSIPLDNFYTPGEAPNKRYEMWISVKFEGPGYSPKSKATQNRALVDRLLIIEK